MKIAFDADKRLSKIDDIVFLHFERMKGQPGRCLRTDARQSAKGVYKFGYRFGIIQSAAPLLFKQSRTGLGFSCRP